MIAWPLALAQQQRIRGNLHVRQGSNRHDGCKWKPNAPRRVSYHQGVLASRDIRDTNRVGGANRKKAHVLVEVADRVHRLVARALGEGWTSAMLLASDAFTASSSTLAPCRSTAARAAATSGYFSRGISMSTSD